MMAVHISYARFGGLWVCSVGRQAFRQECMKGVTALDVFLRSSIKDKREIGDM